MAATRFTLASFMVRLVLALVLVLVTYNPFDPYSFYHWALRPLFENVSDFSVLKGLASVALLIAWGVFLNATFRSLGLIGTVLIALLFTLAIWWLIDIGWISLDRPNALNWLILLTLSLVLAAGVSWSHVRRRLTGQYDVDDVES